MYLEFLSADSGIHFTLVKRTLVKRYSLSLPLPDGKTSLVYAHLLQHLTDGPSRSASITQSVQIYHDRCHSIFNFGDFVIFRTPRIRQTFREKRRYSLIAQSTDD